MMQNSPKHSQTHQGPTLNMLSHDGAVLWECETAGPNGNTLFVFEAQLPDSDAKPVRTMYDTGASGNFVTKSLADLHKLHPHPV